MGDVVSLVERAAANIDAEKAARTAERMRKGQFDLNDMREQLLQMANMGGISGLMGMMPGVAKMKNQIAAAGIDDKIIKRQVAVTLFDDAAGAQEPRHSQGQPQEAHRRRRRPGGPGSQQAAQDAPEHGRHDEGHGFGQARPDGRHRAGDGLWRRHEAALAGRDEGDGGKDAGRRRRRPARTCRRIFPSACARACRTCRASRASAASRPCRASAAFRGRRNNRNQFTHTNPTHTRFGVWRRDISRSSSPAQSGDPVSQSSSGWTEKAAVRYTLLSRTAAGGSPARAATGQRHCSTICRNGLVEFSIG